VGILITDFSFSFRRSPFPWFYFVFFMVMIIHRTTRDVARCRRKYGEAWTRYEKEVPYLFIPVSFPLSSSYGEYFVFPLLTFYRSTSSEWDTRGNTAAQAGREGMVASVKSLSNASSLRVYPRRSREVRCIQNNFILRLTVIIMPAKHSCTARAIPT
jgi:hypothetical protein